MGPLTLKMIFCTKGAYNLGLRAHRPYEAHVWNPGKNLYPRLCFCLNTAYHLMTSGLRNTSAYLVGGSVWVQALEERR